MALADQVCSEPLEWLRGVHGLPATKVSHRHQGFIMDLFFVFACCEGRGRKADPFDVVVEMRAGDSAAWEQ